MSTRTIKMVENFHVRTHIEWNPASFPSILHSRLIVYFFLSCLLARQGDFAKCFRPTPFILAFTLCVARVKSETIIYNVFPPDVWLTPWVNETLAPPSCALKTGIWLFIFSFLPDVFFFFHDSLRRGAAEWKESCEIVERAYGSAIPGAAPSPLPSLPPSPSSLTISLLPAATPFTLLHSTTLGGG